MLRRWCTSNASAATAGPGPGTSACGLRDAPDAYWTTAADEGGAVAGSGGHWARVVGRRCLRVEVADHNTHALRLYERAGFVATGGCGHLPPPRDHSSEHERALVLRS